MHRRSRQPHGLCRHRGQSGRAAVSARGWAPAAPPTPELALLHQSGWEGWEQPRRLSPESSSAAAPGKAGWDTAPQRTGPSEQRATWAAKNQRECRPPPSPSSGGQLRAAFPHKLVPAHPSSRPRSAQPPGAAETWGAAGHRVWPRQRSRGLPGPRLSCARRGSRLGGSEEGAPPGARRGRRAGPAARSAMKGSLTSTIHFPFLAAPANRERVVSAHVFLLQT